MCERELKTEQRLQHIDPHSSGYNSISFSFSWAAQPGAWGPSLCWDIVLIPASSLQLIWISCRRGYIIIWRPPTSCERHNSHSIQPRSPLIFDRMHMLFTLVHFFFWQLSRVGSQYATDVKRWRLSLLKFYAYYFTSCKFFISTLNGVVFFFLWSLNDSKSPKIFRIVTNLNAVGYCSSSRKILALK